MRARAFSAATLILLGALAAAFPSCASAQDAVITIAAGKNINGSPYLGASDVETNYYAALDYYPRADGFLWVNGALVYSQSSTNQNTTPGGCEFGGYFCAWFTMTFPNSPQPSTTYEVQTNGWAIPYYTTQVNSQIVYDDPYGFSLINPCDCSGTDDVSDPYIGPTVTTTAPAIYVGSVYYGVVTPEGPPVIGG